MTKLDWQAIAEAFVHPTGIAILEAMAKEEKPTSPVQIAAALDEPLGRVSYHVSRLAQAGLIDQVDNRPVRGAVEHFYRLAAKVKA